MRSRLHVLLVLFVAQAGCSLLFSTDFPDRAVRTRGTIYEGMTVAALLESRDPEFIGLAELDLEYRWLGEPTWPLPEVERFEAGETRLAIELQLPPDLPMLSGDTAELEILWADASFGTVLVRGLPEENNLSGTLTVDDLEPLYTRVQIPEALTFEVIDDNTNRPVRIRATHSIEINADVSVSAMEMTGGPGACSTGCDTRNILPQLIDLDSAGGADSDTGGGGGVLELTSLGPLVAEGDPELSATGVADGGDGAILLRAASSTDTLSLDVDNDGFIRFDIPGQHPADVDHYHGAAFANLDISDDPSPRLAPAGATRVTLAVQAEQEGADDSSFVALVESNGTERPVTIDRDFQDYDISFDVDSGEIYRVCLLIAGVMEVAEDIFSEGMNCIYVAVP